MDSLYPSSPKDAVDRWDRGDSVWTLEMGGLGPGYEQAIQVFVIEILRETVMRAKEDYSDAEWDAMCEAVLKSMDDRLGGLSGAQYGAARWLAYQFFKHGWDDVKRRAKEYEKNDGDSRWIQVSNYWPRAA